MNQAIWKCYRSPGAPKIYASGIRFPISFGCKIEMNFLQKGQQTQIWPEVEQYIVFLCYSTAQKINKGQPFLCKRILPLCIAVNSIQNTRLLVSLSVCWCVRQAPPTHWDTTYIHGMLSVKVLHCCHKWFFLVLHIFKNSKGPKMTKKGSTFAFLWLRPYEITYLM